MEYKRRHNESVFLRLIVVLVLLAILPCAAISYFVYSINRSALIKQTAVLLSSLAADRELMTRLLIERQRDALSFLANDPKIVHLAGELKGRARVSSDKFMDQIVSRSPFFIGLSVINMATGRSKTAGTFPQDIMERLALEMKQKEEKSFLRAEIIPGGERVFLIGQLIRKSDKDSESGGILLGLTRLNILNDLYKDTSMLGATGEGFLTDSKGVALTALRYSAHKTMGHPIDATAMLDCLAGNTKAFVITPDYVDVPTAMSYRPVQSYGGCVMVHIRVSEVMAPVNTMRNMLTVIVAIMISAVGLIAFLVMRKLLQMNKERDKLEDNLAEHISHMEAMVAERIKINKVLEERTDELEAFSYSVAHDLRGPLRSIAGFAHILSEDYFDKLDEDGKKFINSIRGNAQKMGQLIDDLLKFAQVGRHEIKVQDIDMSDLVKSVIQELYALTPERRIQFNVKALPPARAQQTLIRQVFANLLSNAIKFTRPVENAVIEVGGESKENEDIYYVRDNGIGFDSQYINKIFGVFERLNASAEFEGTGIGLAIVQRIIHRHGGRVWADGKVNEGAIFYFTIPRVS